MTLYKALESVRCILAGQDTTMLLPVTDVPDFDPAADEYVYVAVADHLAARIASGELQPGARLPAERELAREYGVAVGTARRAVKELASRGLVRVLPGRGTFVSRT
jgi:GntR family transcriptional regulator